MITAANSLQRKPKSAIYGAAAGALLIWAGTPIANKVAVASVDPATVGLLRSALAGTVCAALAWWWNLPFPSVPRQRLWLLFSGIASFAAWPLLFSVGLSRTTANHAALLIATIPIFTGLIAAAIDRRRLSLSWLLGVAIALGGTIVLIGLRATEASDAQGSVWGDTVILIGVIACASGYVAGGKLAPVIGTLATTFWGLGTTTIILAPSLALLWSRTDWPTVGTAAWFAIGYMGLLSSLLGYLAWFWALGHGGITRISAWQLVQPVLTVVLAGLLLGERVTVPLMIAGAAVLVGTALTQLGAKR